jgi:ATP synthase protein I
MFRIQSRPIRIVLRWQAGVTAGSILVAGFLAGFHGALSAALGGAISIVAGLAFAALASRRAASTSVPATLVSALQAEAAKIGVTVLLLWLVLALYRGVVVLAFFGTFMATVVIFSMAFFVRDTQAGNGTGVGDGR